MTRTERPEVVNTPNLIPLLLAAFAMPVAAAGNFQLVDEWAAFGAPAYGQIRMPLLSVRPDRLKAEPDWAGATPQYAVFEFTGATGQKVPIIAVLVGGEQGDAALYVDGNGDGVIELHERAAKAAPDQRPPRFAKPTRTVWIAALQRPQKRRVAFRTVFGGMLLSCAVAGYGHVTLPIGEHDIPAALVDANASGWVEHGHDLLYADANTNGRLEPETERFVLAPRLDIAGSGFYFADDVALDRAVWETAPSGRATVTFTIASLPRPPESITAYLSNIAEDTVTVSALNEPMELRAGRYTLDRVILRTQDADGKLITYNFERSGSGRRKQLAGDAPITFELLGNLRLQASCLPRAARGGSLKVVAYTYTDSGLELAEVSYGEDGRRAGRPRRDVPIKVSLIAPGGTAIVEHDTMASRERDDFATREIRIPNDAEQGGHTLRLVYDPPGLARKVTGETQVMIEYR